MTLRLLLIALLFTASSVHAAGLRAGVAKVDITERTMPLVNDTCYAKALVLKDDQTTIVLITLDVVSIGEIGHIGNGFLASIRTQLQKQHGIPASSVIINASHCHGIPRGDAADLTMQAVNEAFAHMVPVKAGSGAGMENRISENRRLKMKDGTEVDMRRAYSMPPDKDVAAVGPIDPQIGLLRLDREDGKPLALLYNFACHPIMNPPSKGNSADYPYYASKVIEENLGEGGMAFFIQGCGGDINPIRYKEVTRPPDAEPLGNLLGLSVLRAAQSIQTKDSDMKVTNETIALPRGADLEIRIASIQDQQSKLLASLKPTNINFKTFLPLLIQEKMSPEYPSHYAQSYLRDNALHQHSIPTLDADNHALVEAYLQNIQTMETLTRLTANLALLKKHQFQNIAAGKPTLDVEVVGLRIGNFRLVTFPGELTVEIGLNIKKAFNDPNTFVAGYTNGYIYYAPTAAQRNNTGYAQEDCDSLVAPEWQQIFETKALEVLKAL